MFVRGMDCWASVPAVSPAYAGDGDHLLPVAGTQWKGRKVAFMGDSITDKAHVGHDGRTIGSICRRCVGLVPFVYGINGQQWRDLPGQCERLRAERGGDIECDPDLCRDERLTIPGRPWGKWYTTGEVPVEVSGPPVGDPDEEDVVDGTGYFPRPYSISRCPT